MQVACGRIYTRLLTRKKSLSNNFWTEKPIRANNNALPEAGKVFLQLNKPPHLGYCQWRRIQKLQKGKDKTEEKVLQNEF